MKTATLRAVGASIAVTLPRQMLRQLELQAGDRVEIASDGKRLTLAPAAPRRGPVRKRYSLAQMLRGMKPGDLPTSKGWDSAPPAGRETW
ncbi:MAG: AbrB/MazE/SpoVT family DNA-binding domain-containing protein [Burkholderiaceae bacterium]